MSTNINNSSNHNSNHQDLGLYFLEKVRSSSAMAVEEEEEAPTELNTINSSGGFAVVSPDKLSVKYTSVNLHGHDVGVVQANKPAPVKRLVYYFEIYVKEAGAKGQIAIGFTKDTFKMRRQPGLHCCKLPVIITGFKHQLPSQAAFIAGNPAVNIATASSAAQISPDLKLIQ